MTTQIAQVAQNSAPTAEFLNSLAEIISSPKATYRERRDAARKLAAITPEEIQAMSDEEQRNIAPGVFAAMGRPQVQAVKGQNIAITTINLMDHKAMGKFSEEQIRLATAAGDPAAGNIVSAAALSRMQPDQIRAIDPKAIGAETLNPAFVSDDSSGSLLVDIFVQNDRDLIKRAVAELTPEQIGGMSSYQHALLTPETLAGLSSKQFRAINGAHFTVEQLTSKPVHALKPRAMILSMLSRQQQLELSTQTLNELTSMANKEMKLGPSIFADALFRAELSFVLGRVISTRNKAEKEMTHKIPEPIVPESGPTPARAPQGAGL